MRRFEQPFVQTVDQSFLLEQAPAIGLAKHAFLLEQSDGQRGGFLAFAVALAMDVPVWRTLETVEDQPHVEHRLTQQRGPWSAAHSSSLLEHAILPASFGCGLCRPHDPLPDL